ncbi:DNA (cytosine-5-)-methyltransferase [Paenibacillus thailandensis]|uniref:Cytosine-specific methyltransferase n=1 Tax=Paenibacillus thailandensis TaxID=393250 RepID=A0ABW5R0E8_9BACL
MLQETSGSKTYSSSKESNEPHEVYNHIARKVSDVVQKRIDTLKIGQKMQDLPEELWHDSFRYYVKEDPNRRGGPNMRMIRLDPNRPSLTVTGYIFNKFVHPYENRFITVREAARLQGFPDNVKFEGTLTSTQQQVGNAVPIPLAKAIFAQILTSAQKLGFHKSNLSGLSLFCGAGGMDIGADQASLGSKYKIDTKVAIDIWDDACNTLRNYYRDKSNVFNIDITKITDPISTWRFLSGEKTCPDIIFGGPPCQAFSQAGKQKGTSDPRGQLIFEFLRFVEVLKPSFFVMENVSNLKGIVNGTLYSDIIRKMDEIGYNVSAEVLSAADFGAPQLRKRIIFIGCKKEIGKIEMPAPSHASEPDLIIPHPYKTVGEAFTGLPKLQM